METGSIIMILITYRIINEDKFGLIFIVGERKVYIFSRDSLQEV